MSAYDYQIERLRLEISEAAGHEHRLHSIAERAANIFAERLEKSEMPGRPAPLNLQKMSDEEAAQTIADRWLQAAVWKAML